MRIITKETRTKGGEKRISASTSLNGRTRRRVSEYDATLTRTGNHGVAAARLARRVGATESKRVLGTTYQKISDDSRSYTMPD